MKAQILLFACLIVLAASSFAQQVVSLTGIIADAQTRQSLEGVSVVVPGTSKGSATDSNGRFVINGLARGIVTVSVSFIGYSKTDKTIELDDGKNAIEIFLKPESTELQTVTVIGESGEEAEAKRVTQNVVPVTVITAKQIENRAGNLNEILARQAGVQIRWSGGIGSESRISVRGLEGKRVQIFLDGNPLNSPDGSLGINDLPVQIIERIEIYKGAVPAWLGGDGLGSAVNVVFRHREVSYIDAAYARQSFNSQIASLVLKKTFDKSGIEAGAGIFDTRTENSYTMKSKEPSSRTTVRSRVSKKIFNISKVKARPGWRCLA
jgi:vitamin B12 transporter